MVRLINNLAYWHQLVQQFFPPLVRKPGRPHLKRNDNLRKFVQSEFQPTFWSEIVRPHASWITFEHLSWFLAILLFTVVCKWSIFFFFAFPMPRGDHNHTRSSDARKKRKWISFCVSTHLWTGWEGLKKKKTPMLNPWMFQPDVKIRSKQLATFLTCITKE